MAFRQNDFIEIEFTGKVKGGEVFDTNIPAKAKEIGLEIETRPVVVCLGQEMLLPALEKEIITKDEKDMGKEFHLELQPENAFGKRQASLVRMIPLKIFHHHKINPQPGAMLMLDQYLVKVISVSGGRVLVDFNNPLAGKIVEYDCKIIKKIDDINEKINCLSLFFFKRKLEFELKGNSLAFKVEKAFEPLINIFKDKFKSILSLDVSIAAEAKPEEKKQEEKHENKKGEEKTEQKEENQNER